MVMDDNRIDYYKKIHGFLLAVLMTMQMQRYNAELIA